MHHRCVLQPKLHYQITKDPGPRVQDPTKEEQNMKAYLYGSEIQVLQYYVAKHGTSYCKVRVIDTGWINNVPTSCIEIRK